MKYIVSVLSIMGIVLVFLFCGHISTGQELEYLRIHIRANSNSAIDQAVKYKVKDAVTEALIPFLSSVESKEEAVGIINDNFTLIKSVADGTLQAEGFNYSSSVRIDNEYFPARSYDTITLNEGYYDALVLELGSGQGNNWWCLVFPAFCFTSTKKSDNIVYISRIWEIIESVIK